MRISLKELAEASGGKILFGDGSLNFENITTSSATIKGNDLFVPVIGERTDGHLYIGSAFAGGATCALTMREEAAKELFFEFPEKGMVLVNSTIEALQNFAAYYRKKYLDYPFIGVTGSVGKTTTREMITAALKAEKKVYSTRGNANSQVGVPITVFEADRDADLAVVELGISEFGEMPKIARIPDVELAVMTNIGISHLAQFKTQENILREKLQILSGPGEEALLLVNGDDPILGKLTVDQVHACGIRRDKKIRILRYGIGEGCDFRAVEIRKKNGLPEFTFVSLQNRCGVRLSVPGDHMVINALAALAVCELYGVRPEKASESLGGFTGFEGRGNLLKKNGYTVINDCYNASPVSMRSGLKVLGDMNTAGRKIAVLADMKELGDEEQRYHRELGQFISRELKDLDILFTYGDLAALIGETVRSEGKAEVREFTEFDRLKKELFETVQQGDLLFLKGSWSMGLGRLIE